jgi:hypothetical protein
LTAAAGRIPPDPAHAPLCSCLQALGSFVTSTWMP